MTVFVDRPRGTGAIAGKGDGEGGGWSESDDGPRAELGHRNPTARGDLGVFGWGEDSRVFQEILSLPHMMPIVQSILGDAGFRMDHSPFCIRMQKGSEGQGLHATSAPGAFDPLSHYIWNADKMHNGLIVVMYQLADVGPEDGGWCCMPGSHKGNVVVPPELRTMEPDHPGTTFVHQPVTKAGDCLIFTEK